MAPKYKGELAQASGPSFDFRFLTLAERLLAEDDLDRIRNHEKARVEAVRKWSREKLVHGLHGLDLLCEHYGLRDMQDPTARYILLSLRLAEDHVPFFQPRKQSGQPPINDWLQVTRWANVQRKQDERSARPKAPMLSISAALKKAGVTRTQYYKALKNPIVTTWLKPLREKLGPQEFWEHFDSLSDALSQPVPAGAENTANRKRKAKTAYSART